MILISSNPYSHHDKIYRSKQLPYFKITFSQQIHQKLSIGAGLQANINAEPFKLRIQIYAQDTLLLDHIETPMITFSTDPGSTENLIFFKYALDQSVTTDHLTAIISWPL